MPHPFLFVTSLKLTEITGRRARTLSELLDGIRTLDGSVIFNHSHHFLLKYQYWLPQPPSDFAYWAGEILQEHPLGEELASISTIEFRTLRQLQDELVRIIERHLQTSGRSPAAPPGLEFNFLRAHTFVLPTRYRAADLHEFREALKKVSLSVIYHHTFEARLRLERETNDFSYWLRSELKEDDVAGRLERMDPYVYSLDQLKKEMLRILDERIAKEPR